MCANFMLLCSLLAAVAALPQGGPCGENEQRACVLCVEATCNIPSFSSSEECDYLYVCKLGCALCIYEVSGNPLVCY
ncbi:maker227 [Drosophila busckii]|uniref:Maker227 n=1 Tax=Drosophila busckii TaxID=30019 RepID=A0A0M3QYA2_DROBS|nr:maker227 [Drosophila busckii]